MDLVIVGDEFYGRRAAGQLGLPYRPMSSVGETDRYIAVVCTADEWAQICAALGGCTEEAVIVCSRDCRPLVQLAEKADMVFAGIPRKDQFHTVMSNPKRREEHMAAERSKIATARSIENLVSQQDGWERG